jgi:hypothetical protein
MADETYKSGTDTYTIKVYPGPADGKKHPMILVVHGNFGLNPPFGPQIDRFATDRRGGLCDRSPALLRQGSSRASRADRR